MNELYSLVFRGEIGLGYQPEQVKQKVQDLLKIDSSNIEKWFSGQRMYLRKGLDRTTAERYKEAFDDTGATCSLEVEKAAVSVQRVLRPAKRIRCPKCDMEQPEALTCLGCGIAYARHQSRQEVEKDGMQPSPEGGFSQPTPIVPSTDGNSGRVGFICIVVVIALLAVGGYFGYQKFASGTMGNVVFTSNDCGRSCQSAVTHLQMAEVEFTEYNIDASEKNLNRFMKYGTSSLPLAIINEKTLVGYDQANYEAVIAELQGKYLEESANKVVMYSSRGSGYCRRAQEFFAKNGIQYIEYDISDPNNRWRYKEIGRRETPLILIDGIRIDGFDQKVVTQTLKRAGFI